MFLRKQNKIKIKKAKYMSDKDICYTILEETYKENKLNFTKAPQKIDHDKVAQLEIDRLQETLDFHNLDQETKKRVKKLITKQYSNSNLIPTRYDNRIMLGTLNLLIKRLKVSAKRLKFKKVKLPRHSILATGDINAFAYKPPTGGEFILFDSDFFVFCHLYIKALCIYSPSIESLITNQAIPSLTKTSYSRMEGVRRMYDLLYKYVEHDDPLKAIPYPVPEELESIIATIRDALELFIVSHEFGHLYGEHFDASKVQELKEMLGTDISNNHLKELDADYYGTILSMNDTMDAHKSPGLAAIPPILFFEALEFRSKFEYLLKNNSLDGYESTSSSTHPSNKIRQEFIKEHAKHFFSVNINRGDEVKASIEKIENLSNMLWSEIETLHDELTKDDFKKVFNDGQFNLALMDEYINS